MSLLGVKGLRYHMIIVIIILSLFFRKAAYRCLLASEVLQLLCIVPVFFEIIGKDPGKSVVLKTFCFQQLQCT